VLYEVAELAPAEHVLVPWPHVVFEGGNPHGVPTKGCLDDRIELLIYGVEQADGHHFLILELVEGQTLTERLAHAVVDGKPRGLGVKESLRIARQVIDALEAAHDKGIIHRDLKPSNIALTADGDVKVLDFGLAKHDAGPSPVSGDAIAATFSPTLTLAHTQAGVILGTAAYMSPEQAKGRVADKRSDVWSFGCVLYEMLTGRRAFEGEDVSDTLAAILRGEPDWSALPSDLPPSVATLIKRCVDRDRRSRIPDVAAPTAIVAAATAAHVLSTRAVTRGAMIAALLFVAFQITTRVSAPRQPAAPLRRMSDITQRLRRVSPEIMPNPSLAPLVEYLAQCTAPDDRILVAGFGPEIPVLAHRPFAARLPTWIPGYYDDRAEVNRAVIQLGRERLGAAVFLDGSMVVDRFWPALLQAVRERGFEEYTSTPINSRVRVWLPRVADARRDPSTDLPCPPR